MDTHGLPIELKVLQSVPAEKKATLGPGFWFPQAPVGGSLPIGRFTEFGPQIATPYLSFYVI